MSAKLSCFPMRMTTCLTASIIPSVNWTPEHSTRDSLKMTPMSVKMINCEMTKKAKYRATTARSIREYVYAPMYFVSLRMMIGSAHPNSADTAGGSTPDTNVNECGESSDHVSRNGTNAVSEDKLARTEMISSGIVLNAQIATSQSQPIVCARRISALLRPKFFQTCIVRRVSKHVQ